MRRLPLLWIAACAILIVAVGGAILPVWLLGGVVAAAIVFGIPLNIERQRRERALARTLWRLLTTR